ncbi:MAG: FkbM family methyltransferase, partial [Terracidiphilus sp.]
YAFESNGDVFNVLCANLALNQITNTKPLNAFIGDQVDASTSGVPWKQDFVSKNFEPPIVPIDSLNLASCAFIKIDVDGKELEVLKSAVQTIARNRPILYLENDVREKSRALLEYLFQNDYVLYWHTPPIFQPDNFFGNPTNHWPQVIVSIMVLCIPKEKDANYAMTLKKVVDPDEWVDLK